MILIFSALFAALLSCGEDSAEKSSACIRPEKIEQQYALLASRIDNLQELEEHIKIQYSSNGEASEAGKLKNDQVKLIYCSRLDTIISILKEGISQTEIEEAKDGTFIDKFNILWSEPYLISNRQHFKDIYLLARRRYDVYGYGDVAFYDLALEASNKIKLNKRAYQNPRDSSEKGFINSFNHITAQAMISSLYSAKIADVIADVHERYNMPELIHGSFTQEQLENKNNNPVDNYVDVINNEIGQILGTKLKMKYGIETQQRWTTSLLANYLNDLQDFYSRSFQIQMKPFESDEEVIKKFTEKLNSYYWIKYEV
ncbi:MAG: hypothetical protein CMP59_05380 [Flavobacteriales bacterium]|nr:hypothetical protein [Flavobacteriales bacterium]|tara:strand:+ start:1242 stop:2183 length:942 start_codon:yes stop_codon:yes gene_type:complete